MINAPGMIELEPGATIRCGDHRYLITHLLDLESVLAREEVSGRIERLHLKDLTATRLDDSSDSIQACELSSVAEADWQIAEKRFATIRPLLGDVRRTRESVAVQAQAAKVNTATVYHWLDIYERIGRVSALLPTKPNGGRGKSRLSPEVETVIKETLENYYLKQQKPSALQRKNGHAPTRQEVLPYLSDGLRDIRFGAWGPARTIGKKRECPYCRKTTTYQKAGIVKGSDKPRFRCTQCQRRYVLDPTQVVHTKEKRSTAFQLYVEGHRIAEIARRLGVSWTAVRNWIKAHQASESQSV